MRLSRLVAVALLSSLLLAGCADEEPVPKMPDTSSPTPSSPDTTETETPEPESAEDFLRRWQAAGDAAQATGDTTELRRFASPKCEACEGFADAVDKIYAAGGSISVDPSTVKSIRRQGDVTFDVLTDYGAAEIRDSATAEPRSMTGGDLTTRVTLTRKGESWLVIRYAQLRS